MAHVKDIMTSGAGNSKPSTSASNAGSAAKASSGSSSGKSAKASVSKGASRGSGSISKAASNAKAAISVGARHAAAKSGSSVGTAAKAASGGGFGMHKAAATLNTAETNRESRQGGGFHQDVLNAQGKKQVNTRQQTTNDELSYLAAATNALANKIYKGEEVDRNSYTAEAFAMANQINQGWKNGVGQAAVVKDGKVVVEADRDIAENEHFWYSLGEDGKKVATQNPAHREENLEMLNNDIQRWTNFANSGNFTRADVINESAAVKQWINAMDDGLVENFQMEDGTSARDYLQSLFDGRESLLTAADRQTAIRDYNSLAAKYTDAQSGLAQGALYGNVNSLITDRETLQNYAAKYADDEELGAAFGNLAAGYYDLHNLARRQEYDHLSAKVDRLDEEFTKAELYESDLKDMVVAGEAEDPGAYERAKSETKKARDAYEAAKAELAAWTPNTSERRDELIAKMHANAGFMRGGLTEEEQKELLDLDAQLFNPDIDYGKDFTRRGAAAVNILKQGAAGIARTGSSALNFVVNGVPKVFNGVADWLVDHSDFARDVDALASELFRPAKETAEWFETGIGGQQEKYAEEGYANISGDKVAEFFNKYGPEAIQMIPMAMVAYATGGAAAGGAFGATQAGDTIQAASQIAQATGLEQLGLMVGNSLKTTAADPNFQTAFMQELGGNYNEAIGDGASDSEAVAYALLCSFLNSEIEIGGGIQDIPESMRDAVSSGKKDVLLAYAKSMVEEGLEEVEQGAVGSALKGMYQPTEIFSTTDQNAIINPLRAVEEFKGGAIGAAFLGAPTTAVNTIRAPGVKGALTVDEQGRVVSALSAGAKKGANRHDTSTGVLAEGFEGKGYVNATNEDEDFRKATTGAQGPRTDAEANQQSYDQMLEEEAQKQAEEEEARKAAEAQEAKRKEDVKLDEQSRAREQEIEGARRAAQAFQDEQDAQLRAAQEAEKYAQLAHNAREFQAEQDFIRKAEQARQAAEEAGRKAEEQLAFAESQSRTLEGQETPVVPAPANHDEVDQGIAGSQAAALGGQESTPKPAPRADLATASETAQGEEEGSAPPETPESTKPSVKLEGNERGEAVTSEEAKADAKEVVGKLQNAVAQGRLNMKESVSNVKASDFQKVEGQSLVERVGNFFKGLGNKVKSAALGGQEVILDERGVKSDIAHGLGKAKAATFAAVPDVIANGKIIDTQKNWKGRGYDTQVIAGRISIDGNGAYVACVVTSVVEDGKNRFYLHEVVDANGNLIYSFDSMNKNAPAANIKTGVAEKGITGVATGDVSSIAQNPQAGNSTNSSTNVQADGTIEAKGVNANDSQANTRTATQDRERIKPGANSGVQEKGSRVGKTRASQVSGEARTKLDAELSRFNARGRETVSDSEYTDSMRGLEDLGDCAVSFAVGGNEDYGSDGFTDSSDDSFGVIVVQAEDSTVEAGETAIHEITHFRLHKFTPRVRDYMPVPNRLKHIVKNVMPSSYYSRTRALIAQGWADLYLTDDLTPSEIRTVQSMNVPNDILRFLGNKLSEPVYREYMNLVNEEMTCELNAGRYSWFAAANHGELTGCEEATKLVRTALVNDGVFEQGSLDNVGDLISRVNSDIQALVDKKAEEAFEQAKKNAEPASKFDPNKRFGLYSVPYNGKRDLIAVRNTSVSSAIRAILDGGIAMPSIAITKVSRGHSSFGEVSFIFRSDTIDPSKNEANNVYSTDAYTPVHPPVNEAFVGDVDAAEEYFNDLVKKILPGRNQNNAAFDDMIRGDIDLSNRFDPTIKAAIAAEAGYDADELLDIGKQEVKKTEEFTTKLNKALGFKDARRFRVIYHDDVDEFEVIDADTGESYLYGVTYSQKFETLSCLVFDEDEADATNEALDKLSDAYGSASAAANALYNAVALGDIEETIADIENKIKAKAKLSQYSKVERIDQDLGYGYLFGEDTESYTVELKGGEHAFIKWDFDSDAFRPESNNNIEKSTRWINQVVEDISQTEQVSRSEAMRRLRQYLSDAAGDSFSRGDLASLLNVAIPDAAVKPWADNFISKFGERKNVLIQGEDRLDPTLKNVLELMRKQNRRGGEDAYSMTASGLHSRLSHWFESFEEIKAHENIISKTRDHDDIAYDHANESLAYLREGLENGYEGGSIYYDTPNADAFLYNLTDRLETRKGVRKVTDKNLIEYVAGSLQQSGWKEHDANTANNMAEYILSVFEEIADLPTGYFEAKPDRIVSKDEYAMLLIPKDSDNSHYATADNDKIQELKRLCDENGISYIEYSNEKSRAQIMANDLGEYLFSKKAPGRTPGRVKQSQSAFEQDVATKGEGANTDAAMGEATLLSRTNEARSRTADSLTEDPDPQVAQQKKDAQAQRLLKEDYVWNDDDVVIAQKLMFDMVKAIRDYQMHKSSRMKPEAFKRMTEQYNQLMTKHQQRLSESGQTLQANYMFSTGDKIVMRAAQTFLGFTKDGRFAGASVNAKNAKIYAGIEEAAKRIQAAVDSEDAQGLAKICKDISDIRNVKKMFGPLGGYASEMESRVLDKIAKGENAAKNLENLAYGNLNAVCDDVQPYKPLNAAKTIRVMNMLSNAATGVNNLANNFAQGAVNRSRVNQALSGIAAKPFAALTGQEVLSQTARGKDARQAVRNAKMEALETATLMQMYGITEENGRLELNDRGMFNPNINPFEQTMSLYKFLTGMSVEATDKMQAAGMLKEMELGIDRDIKAGKIEAHTREQRMQEARHEVNRLLYKDDNSTTALVQHIRDFLNKWSIGNDRVGTIGVGDITMAFAKIPANVVRARLAMTPEGALLQVAQYARGVNKAKRMHAEVLAKGIVEAHQEQIDAANTALQAAYEMEHGPAKDAAIQKANSELSRLNQQMWTEAQSACRGSVYRNLRTIAGNYNENMMFNEAVERAGYMNAKEMSQFEAAQLSRKIGRAAMSAGMMALGSVLRAWGALRDFDQEPDDELRKMNSDKGYKGLMMNLSAVFRKNHEWKDGDLIIDGEFLEVIAMPLTIGATAAEAAATAQDAKTWSWFKSMAGNGIAKTFEAIGDIPGMADAVNMYESLTSAYNNDYEEKTSRLLAGLLQYAANTVPSFFMPNSISQAAAGFDNKVRDVYTADSAWGQAANIFKNKFPGLRNTIPVSVDVWGNERTYGEGLWGAVNKMLLPGDVHVYRKNKYEAEIERMVKAGFGNATPKTTVNSSFKVGDEKYTMTAQEKLDFKAARNTQQRELFEAFIDSDYYKQLDDAERMKVFQSLKTSAERDAKQDMLNGRQLDVEITRDKWETELTDVNDQLQFLAAKQMAGRVWDTDENSVSDYAAMDSFIVNEYDSLNDAQKEILVNSFSRLDDLAEARKAGINSEKWQAAQNIYSYFTRKDEEDHQVEPSNLTTSSEMWAQIQKATGFSDSGKEMKYLQEKMKLTYVGTVDTETYDELVYDYNMSRESAAKVYSAFEKLAPTKGYADVQARQKWKELAATDLADKEKWDTFFALVSSNSTNQIRNMTNLRGKMNPATLKPYTFAEAIHKLGLDTIYWKETLPNGREKKHELK